MATITVRAHVYNEQEKILIQRTGDSSQGFQSILLTLEEYAQLPSAEEARQLLVDYYTEKRAEVEKEARLLKAKEDRVKNGKTS